MMKYVLGILSICCVVFGACSKNDVVPPIVKTPDELLNEGWQAFSTGDFSLARTQFTAAIQGDANLVDAYNGSGWANAELDGLAAAVTSFTDGLSKDSANLAMKAGLAFVYNAQKNYPPSVNWALNVMHADTNWVFTRNGSIDAADLHILLAEDYFALANFPASLQQVIALNTSFAADVSTITGQTALAAEIERLRSLQ